MSDNVYIGRRCTAVSKPPALKPISKVVLWIDNQNCYEAGDSTGREIEITCPYGTQAMAEDLLRKLSGYKYQPMTADDALFDPAAELGDAVTVDDCYTVMASMELTFDGLLTGDIAAPGAVELAQEYQFSDNEKILSRKIARNRSAITKTAEEIRMEISSLEAGINGTLEKYATLDITDDKISAAVKSLEETVDGKLESYTTVTITDDKISAAVKTLEETVDGKLENYATVTITDEKIAASVKSLEETIDGKLENYATVTIADEKISAAVKSLEETVDGKLENYATVSITDEKIAASVKTVEETIDGKLENYATVTIADEKISTAVSTAKTEIEDGIATTLESYTTIEQTSESISAAVTGFVDGETLSSEITAALGELSLSASSADGTTTLKLMGGKTELSTGEFNLSVKSVNISGTLTTDQLHLDGVLTVYDGPNSDTAGGYIGYDNGFNGSWGIGIRTYAPDRYGNTQGPQFVCTDSAARMSYTTVAGRNTADTSVVCKANTLSLTGYRMIQMAIDGSVLVDLDEDGLYPAASYLTLGLASLPWADVYAAGTSMSELLARVEALEGK